METNHHHSLYVSLVGQRATSRRRGRTSPRRAAASSISAAHARAAALRQRCVPSRASAGLKRCARGVSRVAPKGSSKSCCRLQSCAQPSVASCSQSFGQMRSLTALRVSKAWQTLFAIRAASHSDKREYGPRPGSRNGCVRSAQRPAGIRMPREANPGTSGVRH